MLDHQMNLAELTQRGNQIINLHNLLSGEFFET